MTSSNRLPALGAVTGRGGVVTSRTQALHIAALVIARSVPDLAGLALLLDDADCERLAAALRAKAVDSPAGVVGAPRSNARLWAEAGDRALRR